MALQKKHAKGRLDKWYKLAKEKGYRARAAFKLIQLNRKYGFLERSKVLLDLCAAPGSWCQVAAETMPANSLIIGVDLSPIKSIPKVITFQSDITTEKCRATIRQHLKTWKADTVLHDGAPNVGTAWVQDSFNQAELALQSMKLATEFLIEGGTFVTKVFRSKEYNKLLWVFNQLFTKVEATKPPSSRNVSAEIFVVARGFKAPKHLDPRFLDPRTVFAETAEPTPNNEAKVFNPEVKKRKRGGYDEGDYTQFSEFIETIDPIAVLSTYNKLSFEQPRNGNVALAALNRMLDTTEEIRTCCADLRVLGRKDFKMLLKWRLKAREAFGLPTKNTKKPEITEEVAEVESMDEELKIHEELQALRDKDSAKRKRERRRENEKKQKEIIRMQLNMVAPMDIGMEQAGPVGQDAMFSLKPVDKKGAVSKIAKGKMAMLSGSGSKKDRDSGIGSSPDSADGVSDGESDDEEDLLERELDGFYDEYRERKAERDTKYRAKRAREEYEDGVWEGVSGDEQESSDEGGLEEDSSEDSDEDDSTQTKHLITDLDNEPEEVGGLSKRAKNFFSQDIFKDIPGILDGPEPEAETIDEEMVDVGEDEYPVLERKSVPTKEPKKKTAKQKKEVIVENQSLDSDDDDKSGFEVTKRKQDDVDVWEDEDKRKPDGKYDIDIITAEAMTLAHQLATGEKSSYDVMDEGFNKYAFKDRDGLPEWFLDDESRHDRPQKPVSKAAAAAIKEKLRALNARPIKKVREARARKKFKAAQRLEKLRKKSDLLAGDEGLTEKEKADSIQRLLARAARSKSKASVRPQAKLVVARGLNRGIKGRPKGVKGRYKIVDPRMKKELRAQKRIAKKHK